MENKEIKEILENHKRWLRGEPNGIRANFSMADLSVADFNGANLRVADFRGANLSGANFRGANLSGADFNGANLRVANFRGANLSGADFNGANFSGANLSGADLSLAKINHPIACPEVGSFIGFKKSNEGYIIKLEITEGAKRSSATTRKCRCSKAKVLEISTLSGKEKSEAISQYDKDFVYRVGEIVEVKDFDENRWNECSTGIHFFITRQEALDY